MPPEQDKILDDLEIHIASTAPQITRRLKMYPSRVRLLLLELRKEDLVDFKEYTKFHVWFLTANQPDYPSLYLPYAELVLAAIAERPTARPMKFTSIHPEITGVMLSGIIDALVIDELVIKPEPENDEAVYRISKKAITLRQVNASS